MESCLLVMPSATYFSARAEKYAKDALKEGAFYKRPLLENPPPLRFKLIALVELCSDFCQKGENLKGQSATIRLSRLLR